MKLDLGCGQNKHEGFIGVDRIKYPCVDIVWDLNRYPWPFKTNSVEEVLLYNVLEHLYSPYRAMREVIRVCKDGAIVRVRIPYPLHPNAFRDPEHKYLLFPLWFRMFPELEIVDIKLHYPSPILGRIYHFFWRKSISELHPDEYRITLQVRKK